MSISRLPIDLSPDDEGRPRAHWSLTGPAEVVLPDWLETDLGYDQAYAHRLIEECRRVLRGHSPGWTTSGNAYGLTIGPDLTVIDPLFPSPDRLAVSVPTLDLLGLIERWSLLVDQLDPPPHAQQHPHHPKRHKGRPFDA
jgi:hypothetical protein